MLEYEDVEMKERQRRWTREGEKGGGTRSGDSDLEEEEGEMEGLVGEHKVEWKSAGKGRPEQDGMDGSNCYAAETLQSYILRRNGV